MNERAANMGNTTAERELADRGLLPTGSAGSAAVAFMAAASTPGLQRYRGALLGGACGDALGRPAEGRTPSTIRRRFGLLGDLQPDRRGSVGTFTDDTQLTLWTAEALLGGGEDHPELFGRTLAERLDSIRGIGRATRTAIVRLRDGAPWWRSGIGSAGNGVAMRVAPLGLAFGGDLDALRRETARNAVVTHADRLAVASGIIQAYAVARLTRTRPGSLDPGEFITELTAVVAGLENAGGEERKPGPPERIRLVERLAEIPDMLGLRPEEAFAHTYNGAYVLESLPAALWAFLAHPEDAERAVVVAVNGGYDADTVGAMTGTLAGAYLGEGALPRRWVDRLENAEGIRALADRLHRRSSGDAHGHVGDGRSQG